MALSLAAVLAHPALVPSRPLLLAGDPARRTVRWLHSSDIYEIAPLLRGGELLLTTGLGLATSTTEQRRTYVRALAEREIAGLALELSYPFPDVPDDMVAEAQRLDFPFIVLREVYPFVEVTEQINTAILESSIVRLRHADDVGRALSRVLAQRGGLDALTTTLAGLVARPVVLTDATGAVVAAADADVSAVLLAPTATATITADGILLGGLAIGEGSSDDDLLWAATERAPEIFAIEMLRGRQQLLAGRERRDLLGRLLAGAAEAPAALAAHAGISHVRPDWRWVGLAIAPTEGQHGLSLVQDVARMPGVHVLTAELDGITYALLALPVTSAAEAMSRVRSALDRTSGPVAALGPVVPAAAAGRSLRAARQALALRSVAPAGQRLLLAENLVIERLLSAVPDRHLSDLVDEQLGALLSAPNAETLMATLEHYLGNGCSKAATARSLHLRRQSVHQRLRRVTEQLGHDISDPEQHTALRLALAARHVVLGAIAREEPRAADRAPRRSSGATTSR